MPVDSRRAFETVRTLWRLLPETVRVSRPAQGLKHLLGITAADRAGTPPVVTASEPRLGPEPPAPRVIDTLAELDEDLRKLDAASAISDDALRRGFESFVMRYPADWPADPDSAEYRTAVFDLYAQRLTRPAPGA